MISQDRNSKSISELLIHNGRTQEPTVKDYRLKMQAKVYSQNLTRLAGPSRQSQKEVPKPEKNFILKNKKIANASQAITKLERIKKLQLQTQQLINGDP